MSGRNSDIKEISAVGQHGRHGRPWSSLSATSSIYRTRGRGSFVRCAILGAAQWALDCREHIPAARQLRSRLHQHIQKMFVGAQEYRRACSASKQPGLFTSCMHRSVIGLEEEAQITDKGPPSLVLTSPPYPGVHVLYHRWQVRGRKETPAPFWIAGAWDGHGESYYTFGNRKESDLSHYFNTALASFESITRIINKRTKVIQLVAFSNPEWQLPRYLKMMEGRRLQRDSVQIRFTRWSCMAFSAEPQVVR